MSDFRTFVFDFKFYGIMVKETYCKKTEKKYVAIMYCVDVLRSYLSYFIPLLFFSILPEKNPVVFR